MAKYLIVQWFCARLLVCRWVCRILLDCCTHTEKEIYAHQNDALLISLRFAFTGVWHKFYKESKEDISQKRKKWQHIHIRSTTLHILVSWSTPTRIHNVSSSGHLTSKDTSLAEHEVRGELESHWESESSDAKASLSNVHALMGVKSNCDIVARSHRT